MGRTAAAGRNDTAAAPDPASGRRAPARTISRRRALPSSRAVLGALLITLAAVGSFAISQRGGGEATTRYVVATKAIAPGARIDSGSVTTRAMELDAGVADQAFRDVQQVVGSVALGPMSAGQLLQRAEVAAADKIDGEVLVGHELTFPVERDRVPENLRRGERVAVLATYGTGNDARTTTTVQQAIVLGFENDGDAIGTKRSARLSVLVGDPSMVIETAHASQAAAITIVRTTQADVALPDIFRTSVAATASD